MKISFLLVLSSFVHMCCSCNKVYTGLDVYAVHCLRMMPNHIASFSNMQDCFTSTLVRCTQHHQPSTENFQRLCGVLNSGTKLETSQWTKIFHNFAISIQFYEFNLPCSENCKKASLNLWSQNQEFNLPCLKNCANPSTAAIWLTYCGMRLPWSVSFRSHTASIEYKSLYIYPGLYFVIVYVSNIQQVIFLN